MISINIWIVEDDTLYRNTLAEMLEAEKDIAGCEVFPDCHELFEALQTDEQPDLLLMDLGLPGMGGIEGIKKLAQIAPNITVVVLTVFSDKTKVLDALEAGAAGYLLKTASEADIMKGLKDVFLGGSALSPAIAKVVLEEIRKPDPINPVNLTGRELDVLRELARGLTVKEIAAALKISPSTCSRHMEKIYVKLQVNSQSGAVAKALRSRIIS